MADIITITIEMADPYAIAIQAPPGTLPGELSALAQVYRSWAAANRDEDEEWGLGPQQTAWGAAYLLEGFVPKFEERRAVERAAEFEEENDA